MPGEKSTVARTRIRYQKRRESFLYSSGFELSAEYWAPTIFAPYEIIEDVSVASAARELRRYVEHQGITEGAPSPDFDDYHPLATVGWTLDEANIFEHDESPADSIEIGLMPDGSLALAVLMDILVDGDWSERWPELEAVLAAWAPRRRLDIRSLQPVNIGRDFQWRAVFSYRAQGTTVADARQLGLDVQRIGQHFVHDSFPPFYLFLLLNSGHCRALLGLREGATLEVKRAFDIDSRQAQLDLACDVAAMANALTEGVIVIGLATKQERGDDVLHSVHPVPEKVTARRIRGILDRLVYPRLEGIEIRRVPASSDEHQGELLVIYTTLQPYVNTPYMVHGTVFRSRIRANYYSIPFRNDQDTRFMSLAELHSAIQIGLAVSQDRVARSLPLETDRAT